MPADLVGIILDDFKKHTLGRLVLSPSQWATYKERVRLQWDIVKFDKAHKDSIPKDKEGVYTFVLKPGIANHPHCAYLLYVGKTQRQGFRKRFLQYFDEAKRPVGRGREHVKNMVRLWRRHLWFCLAAIDDIAQIDIVESDLKNAF